MQSTWRRCLWKTFSMTWITSELHSWYGKFLHLFSEKCPCNTFLPVLPVIVLFNSVLIFLQCTLPFLVLYVSFKFFRFQICWKICSLFSLEPSLTWNCNQKFWLKEWQILMVFVKAPSWLITERACNKFLAKNLLLYA